MSNEDSELWEALNFEMHMDFLSDEEKEERKRRTFLDEEDDDGFMKPWNKREDEDDEWI